MRGEERGMGEKETKETGADRNYQDLHSETPWIRYALRESGTDVHATRLGCTWMPRPIQSGAVDSFNRFCYSRGRNRVTIWLFGTDRRTNRIGSAHGSDQGLFVGWWRRSSYYALTKITICWWLRSLVSGSKGYTKWGAFTIVKSKEIDAVQSLLPLGIFVDR